MFSFFHKLDKNFLTTLHSLNHDFLGDCFSFLSKLDNWIPIYILLLYFVIKHEKRNAAHILIFIGIILFLSQQITTGSLQSLLVKFIPYNGGVNLDGVVNHVEGYVGKIGTVSLQTVQAFAVSTFLKLVFGRKCKKFFIVFSWPILVSFSQCVVKMHSLNDVCSGAVIGTALGTICFWIFKKRKVALKKVIKYFVGGNIFR